MSGRLLTDAIADVLTDAGLLVGVGTKPADGGWQGSEGASPFTPYVVLSPVTGGYFDGPLGAPFVDARPDYIITSYGATVAQAQFVNDQVHVTLTSSVPTVTGMVVQLMVPDVEGGAHRDDDVTPPVYYSPSRWRVLMTPA